MENAWLKSLKKASSTSSGQMKNSFFMDKSMMRFLQHWAKKSEKKCNFREATPRVCLKG